MSVTNTNANTNANDFTYYLNNTIKMKLEELYGSHYPELVDHEMRQITMKLNKRYEYRFGHTFNELNRRLLNEGIYIDSTPRGYLYGNEIEQTWEWANAAMFNDEEAMKYLMENRKIEEAKYKALFIEDHMDSLIGQENTNVTLLSKHVKSLQRKHMIEKNTYNWSEYTNEKICGYDWI